MKRFLVCFLMVFASILLQLEAQEHMLFMKTPIDGTITEFAAKMRAKGFVQTEVDKNMIIMRGEFMGQECELYIAGTDKTKTVWKVAVFFKRYYTSWRSIKNAYRDIVDSYVGKYGFPTRKFDFFTRPYYEGDGYEIQALRLEKCTYSSYWLDKEEGNIAISMTQSARIRISYEDRINGEKKDEEEQSQINDDI